MSNLNENINNKINLITNPDYSGNGEFMRFDGSYDQLRGRIRYQLDKINSESTRKFEIGIVQMPQFNAVWFLYDRQKVIKAACDDYCEIEPLTTENPR